jgi:predicted enzyme related to lactoylglutathione lyase
MYAKIRLRPAEDLGIDAVPQQSTVRGLRRAELVSPDSMGSAGFYMDLLNWRVLDSEAGFDCWVGERRCATIRAPRVDERGGWRLIFAGAAEDGSLTGPDDTNATMIRGRAQHGPWAPAPRRGEPCWIELFAEDADRADDFWADTLNWTVSAGVDGVGADADPSRSGAGSGEAHYATAGRSVAGRTSSRRFDGGRGWLCYFAVADIDHAENEVHELGGKVIERDKHPPVGEAIVIADPYGAVCALASANAWGG